MEIRAEKLTDRQKRFAELYIELGNASEAAQRAGYKRSYAQLLKRRSAVQDYIAERLREVDRERIADANEVLTFLTDVMRGAFPGEFVEKPYSARIQAALLLGKRLGIHRELNRMLAEYEEEMETLPLGPLKREGEALVS